MNPQMPETNDPNEDANSVVSVGNFDETDTNLNVEEGVELTKGPRRVFWLYS